MPVNLTNQWQQNVITAIQNDHLLVQQSLDVINHLNEKIASQYGDNDMQYHHQLSQILKQTFQQKLPLWSMVLPPSQKTQWRSVINAIYHPEDDTINFDDALELLSWELVDHRHLNVPLALTDYQPNRHSNDPINDVIAWLFFLEASLIDRY